MKSSFKGLARCATVAPAHKMRRLTTCCQVVRLHLGEESSELDMEQIDVETLAGSSTLGTGGGTDHDDASIRARPTYRYTEIGLFAEATLTYIFNADGRVFSAILCAGTRGGREGGSQNSARGLVLRISGGQVCPRGASPWTFAWRTVDMSSWTQWTDSRCMIF